MKKILPLIAVVLLFAAACKKDKNLTNQHILKGKTFHSAIQWRQEFESIKMLLYKNEVLDSTIQKDFLYFFYLFQGHGSFTISDVINDTFIINGEKYLVTDSNFEGNQYAVVNLTGLLNAGSGCKNISCFNGSAHSVSDSLYEFINYCKGQGAWHIPHFTIGPTTLVQLFIPKSGIGLVRGTFQSYIPDTNETKDYFLTVSTSFTRNIQDSLNVSASQIQWLKSSFDDKYSIFKSKELRIYIEGEFL